MQQKQLRKGTNIRKPAKSLVNSPRLKESLLLEKPNNSRDPKGVIIPSNKPEKNNNPATLIFLEENVVKEDFPIINQQKFDFTSHIESGRRISQRNNISFGEGKSFFREDSISRYRVGNRKRNIALDENQECPEKEIKFSAEDLLTKEDIVNPKLTKNSERRLQFTDHTHLQANEKSLSCDGDSLDPLGFQKNNKNNFEDSYTLRSKRSLDNYGKNLPQFNGFREQNRVSLPVLVNSQRESISFSPNPNVAEYNLKQKDKFLEGFKVNVPNRVDYIAKNKDYPKRSSSVPRNVGKFFRGSPVIMSKIRIENEIKKKFFLKISQESKKESLNLGSIFAEKSSKDSYPIKKIQTKNSYKRRALVKNPSLIQLNPDIIFQKKFSLD